MIVTVRPIKDTEKYFYLTIIANNRVHINVKKKLLKDPICSPTKDRILYSSEFYLKGSFCM